MLVSHPAPRYRHIARPANRHLRGGFPYNTGTRPASVGYATENVKISYPRDQAIVASHQGNYATIANYLERELRYMGCRGRGSKRQLLGHEGTPG
jgi:hypothetical protein